MAVSEKKIRYMSLLAFHAVAIIFLISAFNYKYFEHALYEAFGGKLSMQEREDLYATGDLLREMRDMCESVVDFEISDYFIEGNSVICVGFEGKRALAGEIP